MAFIMLSNNVLDFHGYVAPRPRAWRARRPLARHLGDAELGVIAHGRGTADRRVERSTIDANVISLGNDIPSDD
jgi:hypothetical protein